MSPLETPTHPATHAKLTSQAAETFVLAGNAIFTLVSLKTGARYTYRVRMAEPEPGKPSTWFVSLLTGPDNTGDYQYIGIIDSSRTFRRTRKSKLSETSLPVVAFRWVYEKLAAHLDPPNVEIWHAGRCGRCGRTLTVPESIQLGLGPECASKGVF